MTPGVKTSEFWLALLPNLLGLLLVVFGTLKGQETLVVTGAAMLTGTSAGYSVSRGLAKAKEPVPVPKTEDEAANVLEGVK